MLLQSKFLSQVTARGPGFPGGRDIGWFATFTGGEVSSEAVPDKSPGQKFPTQAGGEPTLGEVTLTRRMRLGRDTPELRRFLRAIVGDTDAITVGQKERDANGNPIADGDTYVGTLTSFTPTESDINSQGEPTVITLVVAPSRVD